MKKNYFNLTSILIILISISGFSQVTNGNFEDIKPNFLPRNWGMNFFQQVVIDPVTGETSSDQINYTWCVPSMVYASFEPQSGQYAMEISNAFNATQNKVIPGSATLFENPEDDIPGWSFGVPVNPSDIIEIFGFYYKFIPVGNDVAEAVLSVSDENGNEIGRSTINISQASNEFQYIYAPIAFTSNATPTRINISFSMGTEETANFGSRLIIDNVVTNFQALNIDVTPVERKFKLYPTLADTEINIITPSEFTGKTNYKVFSNDGKLVKSNAVENNSEYVYSMDVSNLSTGIYYISVENQSNTIVKKFIKK